jgi:hypothetical protein
VFKSNLKFRIPRQHSWGYQIKENEVDSTLRKKTESSYSLTRKIEKEDIKAPT